jgi:hypothetical protein
MCRNAHANLLLVLAVLAADLNALAVLSSACEAAPSANKAALDSQAGTSRDSTSVSQPGQSVGLKVAATAESCLGKKMWKGYGLSSGYLGCAAAVSNVLKQSGYTYGHSAAVTQLRNQLLASHCVKEFVIRSGPNVQLEDGKLNAIAKPGDIVLAFAKPPESNWNGGGNAHCGILSSSTDICTNDWNDGIWKKLNIHLMFDYYPYLRIVRIEKLAR